MGGGHRVGSVSGWNSLHVTPLHNLRKQEINQSHLVSHFPRIDCIAAAESSAYLQSVDESGQTNSQGRLGVLVALLPPSLLLLALTVWSCQASKYEL